MSSRPCIRPLSSLLLAAGLAAGLAACGGGGGGGGGDSGGSPAVDLTLSGVVAAGAPVGGAKVSVVDAKGQNLGSTTAHAVEGRYSLKLSGGSPSFPLLVEASGLDAAGNPVQLHASVATQASAMTANVTPLSDALVALLLGTAPAPVFAKAKDKGDLLAALAQPGAASDFLKTLIKSQLTDLKLSASTLDLQGDAGFTANKSAQDLLLEALRVSLTRDAKGLEQLQLGNKLLNTQSVEVQVDLASARTELLKTGGTPANAIGSTLKATTSATKVLANAAALDDLGAALNKLIAQGLNASALTSHALLKGFDKHDGLLLADLAAQLAGYAQNNWQLGRFQFTGCADETQTSATDCARPTVSAPVLSSSGELKGFFSSAVGYNAKNTPAWGLLGNGRKLGFAVVPASWLALEANGAASTGLSAGNPSAGVKLLMRSTGNGATLDKATVQTPGGFSIPLANCGSEWLCISATAGASSAVPTLGMADQLMQPASTGWMGSADTLRGAKYLATHAQAAAQPAWLRAELPTTLPAVARFPQLDGVSASAVLSGSALADAAGYKAVWAGWAAANPDLRLDQVRVVFLMSDQARQTVLVPAPGSTQLQLPQITDPVVAGASVQGQQLWLRAVDASGRWYETRYTVQR